MKKIRFHRSCARSALVSASLCLAMGMTSSMICRAQTPAPVDLTGATLEDLMNIQVTSVSMKEQSLSKTASSIYVITQDDIRHSGATMVPDLLRMVPGVEVARITENTWAIGIRGFNDRYSGQVLVLIDGRSVYSPAFSGVYWDQQTMPLENIERIEVIRGAGGTIWGANAMNGVINIITKSAGDTQGGLVSVTAGSQEQAQGLLQYGGTAGTFGSYRVYSRYATNGDSPSLSSQPAVDDGHESQMGFRSDWNLSRNDKLTVQGDMLGASEAQTITTLFSSQLPNPVTFDGRVQVANGNILARWSHTFANGSEATVQMYFDRVHRFDMGLGVQNTGDFDFHYHFHAGARNDIVAGLGYRVTDQAFSQGYAITLPNGRRTDSLYSGFIQDAIRLTESASLTIGSKFEHNAYTGFEYEPSVQFVWSPDIGQTVWASASRAIQQPSWVFADVQWDETAVTVPGAGTAVVHVSGEPHLRTTTVLNYEAGYRTKLSKRVSMDTTFSYADYDNVQTIETGTPFFTQTPAPPHLVLPAVFGDLGNSRIYGVEASAHLDLAKWWRISPGFSYLQTHFSLDPGSNDSAFLATSGDSPKRQAQLRSNIKLPHNVEWDTSVYYVGSLSNGPVPAYTRLDTRFGWHIGRFIDASITGQNLLTPRHIETLDGLQVTPMETARAVVAKIVWRF
jgi:iron complex outermembrane receptor protein